MVKIPSTGSSLLTALALPILLAGCAVPSGSAVFSYEAVKSCGFTDNSALYADRYIRITDKPGRAGELGGSPHHRHSFGHIHEGHTSQPTETIQPLGTQSKAASARHTHKFTTSEQKPTLTVEHPNELPRLSVGLFVKEKHGNCIPRGAIVGYAHQGIPNGWRLLNGVDGYFLRVAKFGDRAQTEDPATGHSHDISHEHEVVVYKSDQSNGQNVQVFRPAPSGKRSVEPKHGHVRTKMPVTSDIRSSETETSVSYLAIKFIVANEDIHDIPPGVMLLLKKDTLPTGWVRLDRYSSVPLSGLLLRITETGKPNSVRHLPTTHNHDGKHSHTTDTTPALPGELGDAATRGLGNPIAGPGHAHILHLDGDQKLSSEAHLPPYVEFHLIMKE